MESISNNAILGSIDSLSDYTASVAVRPMASLSAMDTSDLRISEELSHLSHARKTSFSGSGSGIGFGSGAGTARPPRTPPLSPTSKRKPAPLPVPPSNASASANTNARSERFDQSLSRTCSISSFSSLNSPPMSPRGFNSPHLHTHPHSYPPPPPSMRTSSPSPPLILTTHGLGVASSSSYALSSSPPLEPSLLPYPAQSHQPQGTEKSPVSTSNSARRALSLDSPVRDPYRFRKPSASARGVKQEYQAQIQAQAQHQQQTAMRQQQQQQYSGYDFQGIAEDQGTPAFMQHQQMQPYHYSPTLATGHILPTTTAPGVGGLPGGGSGSSSPFQGYQALQHQQQQPSLHSTSPHMQTQDPYRSAFSLQQQQQHQHQQYYQQHQQGGSFSPYHESQAPFEELNQMTHNSRYSLSSSSNGGGQRYPMRTLNSQDSNVALSASYHQQQQQQRQTGTTPASSEFGGRSDRYQDGEDASLAGVTSNSNTTRQSSTMQHQYSLTDSLPSQQRLKTVGTNEEEEDENAEILHKVSSSSRSRLSRTSLSSHKRDSRNKNKRSNKTKSLSEDSEEEGQERGTLRQRDSKRCWCCSRRMCVYMCFVFLLILAVVLYFVVPRSPAFSYVSVTSMGAPVMTKNQIQEPFSLQIQVDSTDNYVPIRLSSVEMTVWMKIDMTKIGDNDGLASSFVIKPKQIQMISIPMNIDYTSLKIDTNADGTLQALIGACSPNPTSDPLNLTFGGKMNVWGLGWIWKPQFSFNVGSVPCPANAKVPTMVPSGAGGGTGTGGVVAGASQTASVTASASAIATVSGTARPSPTVATGTGPTSSAPAASTPTPTA